jgi:hypothetical protein
MFDFTEAVANAIVGLAVSMALTVFVLGYTPAGGLAVTTMFTGASFLRAWVLRVMFRKISLARFVRGL